MKHKQIGKTKQSSILKFFDFKNLTVLIYMAVIFFNTSCSKEALEITIPSSSLVTTSSFLSQAYSGNNFSASPTSFQLMFAGSLQTSKTYNVYLGAYSNSSCSSTAPGLFSLSANPVPLVSGLANFSSVNYTNSGPLEEAIYLKASTQPSSINTCVGPISIRHKFSSGSGYSVFHPGGLGAAGASNATKDDRSNSFQMDSRGRYITAGQSVNSAGGGELVIWRYNPDGSLDSSFGSGATAGLGYVIFQAGGLGAAGASNATKANWVGGLQIESQGRYVLAGSSINSLGRNEAVVWRYNSNGSLDSTFGTGATAGLGYIIFQAGSLGAAGASNAAKNDWVGGLKIDSQGKYVLHGYSRNSAGGYELVIWRYNPDGSLDYSFGNGVTAGLGYVRFQAGGLGATGVPNATKYDSPEGFQIDSQGKYVFDGTSTNSAGGSGLVIWRYNPDGSLDSSFGNGATAGLGYVIFQAGGLGAAGALNNTKDDKSYGMNIDSMGRYVMSGASYNAAGGYDMVIWRYNPDGSLDSSFGSGATAGLGYILFQAGGAGAAGASNPAKQDYGWALAIDPQGKYVVSGTSKNLAGGYELAIWRYNPDGSLDSSFGSGATAGLGYILFQAGGLGATGRTNAAKADYAWKMVLDSQGRYVLDGTSFNPAGGFEHVFWRYLPSGELDR